MCINMEEENVPKLWRTAIIIPVYMGKGIRREYEKYKSLRTAGKVYGKIVPAIHYLITFYCVYACHTTLWCMTTVRKWIV